MGTSSLNKQLSAILQEWLAYNVLHKWLWPLDTYSKRRQSVQAVMDRELSMENRERLTKMSEGVSDVVARELFCEAESGMDCC